MPKKTKIKDFLEPPFPPNSRLKLPTGPVAVHPRRPSRSIVFISRQKIRGIKRSGRRGAPEPRHPSGIGVFLKSNGAL